MGKEQRKALLRIGAHHPAFSVDEKDKLAQYFNNVTKIAREAVGAVGNDEDQKADWCSDQLEQLGLSEECIRVEYDPEYSGGNYSGVGQFAYLPVKMLDAIQGETFERKVEIVFEKTTGYFKENIIHYSNEIISCEQ